MPSSISFACLIYSLIIPYLGLDADHFRCKCGSVMPLKMLRTPKHILESDIEERDIAVSDKYVGKIREIPERAQIHARYIGHAAKGNDHKAERAYKIDEALALRYAVGAYLCK